MNGLFFTEFMEMVEQDHGMEVADRVISKGCPFHMGFTAVGNYDHQELLGMMEQLSRETGTAAPELMNYFGRFFFGSLLRTYPYLFEGIESTEQLLQKLEATSHDEFQRLGGGTELPTFQLEESSDGVVRFEYRSEQPFADLCYGLLAGSITHFGEAVEVRQFELEGEPGTHARFEFWPV